MNKALKQAGEDWEKSYRARMPLEELIKKAASQFNVQEKSILSASRKRNVSDARGIICCLAVNDFGYSTAVVGRALGIRRVSADQCVARGKRMFDKELELREKPSLN